MSRAPAFHPSWPPGERDRLLRAIDRHGGWSLWERLEAVSLSLVRFGGLVPWIKGSGRTFVMPRALTCQPKRGRVEWYRQAGDSCLAVFEAGHMRLLDPGTGQVTLDSPDHRQTFRGLRKLRRWRLADAGYFFGYAFATYVSLPFVLPALPFVRPATGRWRGEALAGVEVEFPADAHVHSRRQRFLFDRTGLLRRNDYVADVVGPWARGAHGLDEYATVEGLPIPTRRTVLPRLGTTPLPFPVALSATFEGFAVAFAG